MTHPWIASAQSDLHMEASLAHLKTFCAEQKLKGAMMVFRATTTFLGKMDNTPPFMKYLKHEDKTQTVILSPKTVTLSFRTNPAGLNVTVGGTTATAPFSRTIIQNGGVSFSVPSPQNQKGRLYFQEWSDGTKRLTGNAQQLTATTSTTYTATFIKR